MALLARDVLTGQLPGPCRDEQAERFARLVLGAGRRTTLAADADLFKAD